MGSSELSLVILLIIIITLAIYKPGYFSSYFLSSAWLLLLIRCIPPWFESTGGTKRVGVCILRRVTRSFPVTVVLLGMNALVEWIPTIRDRDSLIGSSWDGQ